MAECEPPAYLRSCFRDLPEFTFLCPNKPAVHEAVLAHLHDSLRRGEYNGVFLDRIRHPCSAENPARWPARFCNDCCRAAAEERLDLEVMRQRITTLFGTPGRIQAVLRVLLDSPVPAPDPDLAALRTCLDFRTRSITRVVQEAASVARAEGLAVGLDCFAPALTYMVGQDLTALNPCCDWIKVMVYGHTLGPAGLPFELLALADWLVSRNGVSEPQTLEVLSKSSWGFGRHGRAVETAVGGAARRGGSHAGGRPAESPPAGEVSCCVGRGGRI